MQYRNVLNALYLLFEEVLDVYIFWLIFLLFFSAYELCASTFVGKFISMNLKM